MMNGTNVSEPKSVPGSGQTLSCFGRSKSMCSWLCCYMEIFLGLLWVLLFRTSLSILAFWKHNEQLVLPPHPAVGLGFGCEASSVERHIFPNCSWNAHRPVCLLYHKAANHWLGSRGGWWVCRFPLTLYPSCVKMSETDKFCKKELETEKNKQKNNNTQNNLECWFPHPPLSCAIHDSPTERCLLESLCQGSICDFQKSILAFYLRSTSTRFMGSTSIIRGQR